MWKNSVIDTDAYKITHWLQRPNGINHFYSYGEARKGGQHAEICFFGMQYILKEYFMQKVTQENIERGAARCKRVFGTDKYFPKAIWEKVKKLGYFPLEIKCVKEGTVLPTGNVCFTIESTEPWFACMVSHFEDYLMWNWQATGVATRLFNIKKGILPYFNQTCDTPDLSFAVNDFGLRGAVYREGAVLGGMAMLIFSNGSDNLPAMEGIEEYYTDNNIGQSVWATEHSVATVWGPGRGEIDYVLAQLNRSEPHLPISIVMDSYDSDGFIPNVLGDPEVKKLIIERPGRVIPRPDSNDPLTNVIKYSEQLGKLFGYHLNNKEYKVVNHNVGLLQGDGMNEKSIPEIYKEYIKTGWSCENFNTGSGGGLHTDGLCRDTDRWAVKVSHIEIEGESVNVQKTPKSDMTKASKAGLLKLHKSGNSFMTIQSSKEQFGANNGYLDVLQTVYRNGELFNDQTFTEIRKTADDYLQHALTKK